MSISRKYTVSQRVGSTPGVKPTKYSLYTKNYIHMLKQRGPHPLCRNGSSNNTKRRVDLLFIEMGMTMQIVCSTGWLGCCQVTGSGDIRGRDGWHHSHPAPTWQTCHMGPSLDVVKYTNNNINLTILTLSAFQYCFKRLILKVRTHIITSILITIDLIQERVSLHSH